MEIANTTKILRATAVASFVCGCFVQLLIFQQKDKAVLVPRPVTINYPTNPDLPSSNNAQHDMSTFIQNRYLIETTTASYSLPPDGTN